MDTCVSEDTVFYETLCKTESNHFMQKFTSFWFLMLLTVYKYGFIFVYNWNIVSRFWIDLFLTQYLFYTFIFPNDNSLIAEKLLKNSKFIAWIKLLNQVQFRVKSEIDSKLYFYGSEVTDEMKLDKIKLYGMIWED